ncbi:hypothetical protein Pelo_19538 [Pelomyxa schiedti]|nr:hypothetical protein Pelo_19538 [Pelomyxa schiedti]
MIEFMSSEMIRLRHLLTGARSPSSLVETTSEFVVRCLTSGSFEPHSSKIVKWLIREFHLEYEHISEEGNALLFKLLVNSKNRCAEWLIDSFSIPLSDICAMSKWWARPNCAIDLSSWQMILNKFPNIDATLIRENHLMTFVVQSPENSLCTFNHCCGITKDEVREYCARRFNNHQLTQKMKVWLGIL